MPTLRLHGLAATGRRAVGTEQRRRRLYGYVHRCRWRLIQAIADVIGEGIVGLMRPRRYIFLWEFGAKPYQEFIEKAAGHKGLTRLSCGVEAEPGVWLALRQTSK